MKPIYMPGVITLFLSGDYLIDNDRCPAIPNHVLRVSYLWNIYLGEFGLVPENAHWLVELDEESAGLPVRLCPLHRPFYSETANKQDILKFLCCQFQGRVHVQESQTVRWTGHAAKGSSVENVFKVHIKLRPSQRTLKK